MVTVETPARNVEPYAIDPDAHFFDAAWRLPEHYDGKLRDRMRDLWHLSADDANRSDSSGILDWFRLAYFAYCTRLRHLARSLHADAELARQQQDREHPDVELFRDALLAAVKVEAAWEDQTHRNGDGVVHREETVEYHVDGPVTIDLGDFDDDCVIPRFVEARYGGSTGGRQFDVDLVFTLVEVQPAQGYWSRKSPKGVAVYSVEAIY